MKSNGVSSGAVGGIAGGIVGVFLLIGAAAFFILFHRRRPAPPDDPEDHGDETRIPETTEPENITEKDHHPDSETGVGGRLSYPLE